MKFPPRHFLRGSLKLPHLTPSRFSVGGGEVASLETGVLGVEWILSRSLCRFARFELGHVPQAARAKALKLAIADWSLYPETASSVVWNQSMESAAVWVWDPKRLATSQAQFGKHRGGQVFPETLLQSRGDNETRLVICIEGFEAQAWKNGELQNSRWWPLIPEPVAWNQFLRDASVSSHGMASAPPEPRRLPWLPRRWGGKGAFDTTPLAKAVEVALISFAAFAFCTVAFWQALHWSALTSASEKAEATAISARQASEPVAAARNETLRRLAATRKLAELNRFPDQLSQINAIIDALPKGTILREWDYDRGRLKLTFAVSSAASMADLIKSLQGVDMVAEASVQPTTDPLQLIATLTIRPLHSPPTSANAETSASNEFGPSSAANSPARRVQADKSKALL